MSLTALILLAVLAAGLMVLHTPEDATIDSEGWRGPVGIVLCAIGGLGLVAVGAVALVRGLV